MPKVTVINTGDDLSKTIRDSAVRVACNELRKVLEENARVASRRGSIKSEQIVIDDVVNLTLAGMKNELFECGGDLLLGVITIADQNSSHILQVLKEQYDIPFILVVPTLTQGLATYAIECGAIRFVSENITINSVQKNLMQALSQMASKSEAALREVRLAKQEKKYEEALAALRRNIDNGTLCGTAQAQLLSLEGELLLELDQDEEAIEIIERSVACSNSLLSASRRNLARLKQKQGDWKGAMEVLCELETMNPLNVTYKVGQIEAAVHLGDRPKVEALIEDVLREDDQAVTNMVFQMSNLMVEKGMGDSASAMLNKFSKVPEATLEQMNRSAMAFKEAQEYDRAESIYLRVISKLRPKERGAAIVHFNLAVLYKEWGKHREAITHARMAIEIDDLLEQPRQLLDSMKEHGYR